MKEVKCQIPFCLKAASGALALSVPTKIRGVPAAPVRVVLKLRLCEACVRNVNAPEVLAKDVRMQQTVRAAAPGLWPDFAHATATLVRFDSAEWRQLGDVK